MVYCTAQGTGVVSYSLGRGSWGGGGGGCHNWVPSLFLLQSQNIYLHLPNINTVVVFMFKVSSVCD